MVGDFHKLDRFGELVFGDEKGEVPPPKPAAAKDEKPGKDDKGAAKGAKAAKEEKPAKDEKGAKGAKEEKAKPAKEPAAKGAAK